MMLNEPLTPLRPFKSLTRPGTTQNKNRASLMSGKMSQATPKFKVARKKSAQTTQSRHLNTLA